MLNVVKVAGYIFDRYMAEFKERIDEMKLHKLLYFTQRETMIVTGGAMFEEQFEAWKYGPVMVQIRELYRDGMEFERAQEEELRPYKMVFDYVFENYAVKDSWSLSMLTHGEKCWQIARKGVAQDAQCDVLIKTEDIAKDAQRIKVRRFYFSEILPKLGGRV